MAIGPVQLVALGFKHPDFRGEIIEQLELLRASDTVRVIDALAVYKDAEGDVEIAHLSNLTHEEAVEFGTAIGALLGFVVDGEEGAVAGAAIGATAGEDGVRAFDDEEAWDVVGQIPDDSAAALVLLEHVWAIPLRDAVRNAGGFRISDGFIHPEDLVTIGLLAQEHVDAHTIEEPAA